MWDIRRRKFIGLLGGAAAWPLAARAQQASMPVVGFLHYASPDTFEHVAQAFRRGLRESGYIDGRNVVIEYRWADGHYDRLPALVGELVRREVTVIAAGGTVAAQAAKRATTSIPIVFTSGADPIASGLVGSLSRPEGNLTGATGISATIVVKRLELTRDLLPGARAVAMIINPNFPGADAQIAEVEAAGRLVGMQIRSMAAGSERDLDAAFATLREPHVDAFMVGADGYLNTRRHHIAALAARYAMPGIYPFSDYVRAGGLVSYGANVAEDYRQAGISTGRILKGEKPADLPVVQPTKYELVINLKTAKALGLEVPPTLLARADEVIE
jgi:putative ABC transport system substrate-binding protein